MAAARIVPAGNDSTWGWAGDEYALDRLGDPPSDAGGTAAVPAASRLHNPNRRQEASGDPDIIPLLASRRVAG